MFPDPKEPCRKCLLMQSDEKETYRQVKECIEKIKPGEKTPPDDYAERLKTCENCDFLLSGTCLKCGCYPELRAAFKKNKCPMKKWA